jgi:hypothetical protein
MKLKYKDIKTVRTQQLEKQNFKCCLCGDSLTEDEAVLDHDHKTGLLRGVIHRGDNILLGKIENAMPRTRVDLHRLSHIADNLIKYLTADPISEYLHPTFKTPEERKMGRGRGKGKKPPKR